MGFPENLGLRETVNKAANALPSSGTAVAANKLATPRNINGVPFDGTQDILITSGMSLAAADERYVQSIRRGSIAIIGMQYNIFEVPDGCVLTGLDVAGDGNSTVTAYYRPMQYLINGSWP